jgi:hypothetical protein
MSREALGNFELMVLLAVLRVVKILAPLPFPLQLLILRGRGHLQQCPEGRLEVHADWRLGGSSVTCKRFDVDHGRS